ncbi:MAG: hypothetical protein OEZ32_12955 [Nitrospinota bacterium]|nr:hypothetical protein [Nitrospinota bacterium]
MSLAIWPVAGDPASAPCRLFFSAPLRLLKEKRLIETPTFPDLVVGAFRRLRSLVGEEDQTKLNDLHDEIMDIARIAQVAGADWERLDLVCYSGSQKS